MVSTSNTQNPPQRLLPLPEAVVGRLDLLRYGKPTLPASKKSQGIKVLKQEWAS